MSVQVTSIVNYVQNCSLGTLKPFATINVPNLTVAPADVLAMQAMRTAMVVVDNVVVDEPTLERALVAAFQAMKRLRYVIISDSQGQNGMVTAIPTGNPTYDTNTGVLTIPASGGGVQTGEKVQFLDRAAPQFNCFDKTVTMSGSNITVTIATGLSGTPSTSASANSRWGRPCTRNTTGVQGHLMELTNSGVQLVRNIGVTGDVCGDIAARLANDLAGLDYDFWIMNMGHNDMATSTAEYMFAKLVQAIQNEPLVKPGVVINLTPPAAAASQWGGDTVNGLIKVKKFNAYIDTLPSLFPGRVERVDAYTLAAGPDGLGVPATLSDNLLHWGGGLARNITRGTIDAVRRLKMVIPSFPMPILQEMGYDATNNANARNKFSNPCVGVQTGGTLNGNPGVAASNFNILKGTTTTDVLASIVPAASGYGFDQKVQGRATAADDYLNIRTTNQSGRFAAGDLIQVGWFQKTENLAVNAQTKVLANQLGFTNDGVAVTLSIHNNSASKQIAHQEDMCAFVASEPIQLPTALGAGLSNLDERFLAQMAAATGLYSIQTGNVLFWKLN